MSFAVSGVNCAVATPLNADLSPDLGLLGEHGRQLLENGCDGLALLGTTGEANSFSIAERKSIVEAALKAGIAPEKLLPGVGVAAFVDTVELTRHALSVGVTSVVMLPPFYYKGVSDDGIFAAYARIIEAVADNRLRIILYHIPPMSAVPLSRPLVARLIEAFPDIVIGLKDSSGDLSNMQALAAAHPGFSVLSGADPLMLPLLRSGGAGCITACANLVPEALRFIYDNYSDPAKSAEIDAAQARVEAWRKAATIYMQLPSIKALLALKTGNPGWARVRPTLMPLAGAELADITEKFATLP